MVTRSSINTPIYALVLSIVYGDFPKAERPALKPAIIP
jgi:hypothetical protein